MPRTARKTAAAERPPMSEAGGHYFYSHPGHSHPGGKTQTDTVCGMLVDPATTPHHHDHQGKEYFFCSAGCAAKFAATPDKYLHALPAPVVAEGTIFTCPMHPEVRQVGPGACPICGMALEPLEITNTPQDNGELRDMTRRFWIGSLLTLPIFAIEMGGI